MLSSPVVTFTLPFSTNPLFIFDVTVFATYFPFSSALVIVNVIGVSFNTYPSGAVTSVIVIVSLFMIFVIFIFPIVISPL